MEESDPSLDYEVTSKQKRGHPLTLYVNKVWLCAAMALLMLTQAANGAPADEYAAVAYSRATYPHELAKRDSGGDGTAVRVVKIICIPVLVLLSGLFAGLTLGYMSLDATQLVVLSKTGTPREKRYADKVLPVRKDGHLLLTTLTIANMICNETLPVITESILTGVIAVVVSIALIVVFSEIIPHSVCSRYGLVIGAHFAWLVRILIVVFFVIAWPVAKVLEYFLGAHHGIVYRRAELKELMEMHSDQIDYGGDLNRDTIAIVNATLDLQHKSAIDAMTPMSELFSLDITDKLDYPTMLKILHSGHSRIPVFRKEVSDEGNEKTSFVGCLLTKQLILVDPEEAMPLQSIPLNYIPTVPSDMLLLDMLNTFQEGRSHMAVVCPRIPAPESEKAESNEDGSVASDGDANGGSSDDEEHERPGLLSQLFSRMSRRGSVGSVDSDPEKSMSVVEPPPPPRPMDMMHPLGIITLEDILEEIIGEEIYDESDRVGKREPALSPYIPPEAVSLLADWDPDGEKSQSVPVSPRSSFFLMDRHALLNRRSIAAAAVTAANVNNRIDRLGLIKPHSDRGVVRTRRDHT